MKTFVLLLIITTLTGCDLIDNKFENETEDLDEDSEDEDDEQCSDDCEETTVNLKPDISTSHFTPAVGQTFLFRCDYPNGAKVQRAVCKGEDPSSCITLKNNGRINVKADNCKTHLNVTIRGVTAEDAGTYWCSAGRSAYGRVLLTVAPDATPSTPSTTSLTTPASNKQNEVSKLPIILPVVVCGVLLLLLPVWLLVYKRWKRSDTWTHGGAGEERAYEEIQERPRQPALPTIYSTATFPAASPVPPSYSVITFKKSSDTSGAEYSTVTHPDPSPAYSTVNHPLTTPSGDPVYSTLSVPQQH